MTTIAEFYRSRFGSDPYALLEEGFSDLSSMALDYGVDWSGTVSQIKLSRSKGRQSKLATADIEFADKAYKGRIGVWAEEHVIDAGAEKIAIPFVSFVAKGGIRSDSWNGFQTLREIYDREVSQIISEEEQRQRAERIAKKAAERAAKLAEIEAKQKAKAEAMSASVAKDIALFHKLPHILGAVGSTVPTQEMGSTVPTQEVGSTVPTQEVGSTVPTQEMGSTVPTQEMGSTVPNRVSHQYAIRKQIIPAFSACDVRVGSDKYGRFLAILFSDIKGNPRTVQRIYEKKFQKSADSNPTDKTFTWGADNDSAFFVIGNLSDAIKNGGLLRFCEGFATGCTNHIASGDCVIVCMSASNLKKVVAQFVHYYPNAPKIVDADNDCWTQADGKGNAGMLAALEISADHGIRACFPTFDDVDTSSRPSDFNDLAALHTLGIKGVCRQMRASANKLEAAKGFEFKLQRLSFVPRESVLNEALAAVSAGMSLAPFKYHSRDILKMVFDSICVTLSDDDIKKIKSRAKWLSQIKMKKAQSFRNFSTETLAKPHVNYERVEPVLNAQGHHVLPPKVLRKVQSLDGPIIVRAPMASGKTKHLLAPLMQQAEKGAYLAHRVSLIADACNRLSLHDDAGRLQTRVDNYQDILAPMVYLVDRLGCCINSITHPKFESFFASVTELLIDEASQTLRHVSDGTVENPVLVLEKLAELIRTADRTVMCDADANDALVEFVEKACPGQTIHIIEMAADCSAIEVLHSSGLMAHQSVIEALRRDETILVADDSAKDGAALAQRIRTECPGKKVLHVHKDSKGEVNVEAFLSDPNGQAPLWDAVIYSPAISSGVSIEIPHFKNHVGIFCGTVAPSDAIQMLRRDRTARRYVIGFDIIDHKREVDKDRIFRGRVAADKRALMTDGREITWQENDAEIVARWRKTLFDDVWLSATAAEREARADFANNMLLILIGDGYKVERLDKNPLAEEQAAHGKKAAKAAVNEARHQQILGEVTPSHEAAQRLMRRDVMSTPERAQLVRYHIETQLCVAEVNHDHIDFWENAGPKRLARFETLRADLSACQAFDNHLAARGVTTTRRLLKTAQHLVLRKVFAGLGLDINTGAGEFNAEHARDTMATILTSEAAIEEYNEIGVGPYVNPRSLPKCATRWAKAVLERLGLDTQTIKKGKAKTRHQVITPESWSLISDYAARRALSGVSSLTIHDDNINSAQNDAQAPTEAPTTATGEDLTASPRGDQGGALLPVVFKGTKEKALHLKTTFPRAFDIASRICAESSVLFFDEIVEGLAAEVWEHVEAGLMSEESLRYWLGRFAASVQRDESKSTKGAA